MYLTGTYSMNMDSKDRLTLPAAHRKDLPCRVTLAPIDGCVCGYTPEGYEAFVKGLFEYGGRTFNPRSKKDKQLKRHFDSIAVTVDVDNTGRVALGKLNVSKPNRLENLGLSGKVTVVGNGDHFEVWNSERWIAEQQSIEDDLDELLYND